MDDELQLISEASPVEITFTAKTDNSSKESVEDREALSRVGEENHNQTPSRPKVRRRLLKKLTRDPLTIRRGKEVVWIGTVALLGITAFLLLAVPLLVDTSRDHEKCRDFEELSFGEEYEKFPYIFSSEKFEMCRQGETVLSGYLGTRHSYISEVKVDLYAYTNDTLLNITKSTKALDNCLRVEWVGIASRQNPLTDCFDLELGADDFWFATYEVNNQTWAINNVSFPPTSFVPKDYLSPLEAEPHVFGPILHPLWLSSRGAGIHVDPQVQLYVSVENKRLCLSALPFELECAPGAANHTFFNYTICVFDTVAQTAQHFLANSGHIPHVSHQPDSHVFQYPVWSTSHVGSLNDETLQSLLDGITGRSFNVSLLQIEDGYSTSYGDLTFQNSAVTPQKLLELSAHVNLSVWVHPFVNYDTINFTQDVSRDYYLPSLSDIEGNSVSLVKWWRGYGAVINFLDSGVRKMQADRFNNFVQYYHLKSLSFDGGEYTYLPKCVYTKDLVHPADYVRSYVQMVGNSSYSVASSVRVGYFTQDQPVFVQLLEREFSWDETSGLKSVLNAVISVGLGGYSFVIPNKIGGNVTQLNNESDRDLYIRWVQLCAFLPVMEFGFLPWTAANQTVLDVVKDMTALHNQLVTDASFQNALSNSTANGYPIIRPLWWLADRQEIIDKEIFMISDQFLIGDDIMAAPILTPNTVKREVYFPKGTVWVAVRPPTAVQECTIGDTPSCAHGRKLNFSVPLIETLYFRRVNDILF